MDMLRRLFSAVYFVYSVTMFVILVPVFWLFNLFMDCFKAVYPDDLAGKVVLITGASSGIGEHLAIEFAKYGARLALVARREKELTMVAQNAKAMGSPDVIWFVADVSKVHDCNRFVHQTVKHFGKLDYLVNNAAVATFGFFEDQTSVPDHVPVMDINFWGSVYTTHFAFPHLKKNQGRIIVICSCGSWFGTSRLSVYNASKAALLSFFETLRNEVGSCIDITIVTPGFVKSNIIKDECFEEENTTWTPKISAERCAKAIVNSTRHRDKYLTQPSWINAILLWKIFCPEIFNFISNFVLVKCPKISSKRAKSNNLNMFQPVDLK